MIVDPTHAKADEQGFSAEYQPKPGAAPPMLRGQENRVVHGKDSLVVVQRASYGEVVIPHNLPLVPKNDSLPKPGLLPCLNLSPHRIERD